jgi:hypothetical protein
MSEPGGQRPGAILARRSKILSSVSGQPLPRGEGFSCRVVRGVAERFQGQAAKRQNQLWRGIEDCVLPSSDICVSKLLHISCRKSCQVPLQARFTRGPFWCRVVRGGSNVGARRPKAWSNFGAAIENTFFRLRATASPRRRSLCTVFRGVAERLQGQAAKRQKQLRHGVGESFFRVGTLCFQAFTHFLQEIMSSPPASPVPTGTVLVQSISQREQCRGRAAKGQEQFSRGAGKYFLPPPGSRFPVEKVFVQGGSRRGRTLSGAGGQTR